MTLTLTGFLTARLDEAAGRLPVTPPGTEMHRRECSPARCDPGCPTFIADRIVCDRAIVDAHTTEGTWEPRFCTTCHDYDMHDGVRWPCPTLRWLAVPYRYHPDYRPEWALTEDHP